MLSNRKKSLEGMKRKRSSAEEDSEVEDPGMQNEEVAAAESDDEVEYYRQAVGAEPDEGAWNRFQILPLGSYLEFIYSMTLLCRHVS